MLHTIIGLKNGVKVGGLSNQRDLHFEDGSILPRADSEIIKKCKVIIRTQTVLKQLSETGHEFNHMTVLHIISNDLDVELQKWIHLHTAKEVDIVIIPFPMLQALISPASKYKEIINNLPFRTVLWTSTRSKIARINQFGL